MRLHKQRCNNPLFSLPIPVFEFVCFFVFYQSDTEKQCRIDLKHSFLKKTKKKQTCVKNFFSVLNWTIEIFKLKIAKYSPGPTISCEISIWFTTKEESKQTNFSVRSQPLASHCIHVPRFHQYHTFPWSLSVVAPQDDDMVGVELLASQHLLMPPINLILIDWGREKMSWNSQWRHPKLHKPVVLKFL